MAHSNYRVVSGSNEKDYLDLIVRNGWWRNESDEKRDGPELGLLYANPDRFWEFIVGGLVVGELILGAISGFAAYSESVAKFIIGLACGTMLILIIGVWWSWFGIDLWDSWSLWRRRRQYSFKFGKSGNAALDKFIFEKSLKWIPYKKLDNVEYLDKGGFGTIYKATWLDNYTARNVVLKCSNILNENLDEFLNEWKYHEKCLKSLEIINLHGFTKNPEKGYMVVMDYANEGNLRGNLSKIVKNDWREKLYILYKIISGLNEIHEQNLIHCDFHDGNILIDGDKVYISDLGLCQPVSSSKKGDIHGVIPFMAPEILRGKSYTRTSDIYSFAMIMWEFTSGIPPFSDRAHNFQLVISICEGERPKILQSTPQCYINLMKRCWHENLSIRPSASDVKDTIKKWIFYPNDDKIEKKFISNIMEFINAPIEHNDLTTKIHPQAYYTSRLHNFTSEQLNKTLESKRLDRIKYGNLESNDLVYVIPESINLESRCLNRIECGNLESNDLIYVIPESECLDHVVNYEII